MAKDIIHDAVKHALITDGWTIIADPFRIEYKEFSLLADLAAERPFAAERNGRKIAVEIKSFIGRSLIKDFQQALGQYAMYRDFLELIAPEYELWLAVNSIVYTNFFKQQAARLIVERHQIKLLTVNIDKEEVQQWIS